MRSSQGVSLWVLPAAAQAGKIRLRRPTPRARQAAQLTTARLLLMDILQRPVPERTRARQVRIRGASASRPGPAAAEQGQGRRTATQSQAQALVRSAAALQEFPFPAALQDAIARQQVLFPGGRRIP